jgi:hypothetical protein
VPASDSPPRNLGSLTFDGPYAIAASQGPPVPGDHGVAPGAFSYYLERCGTHLHRQIVPPDVGFFNAYALMRSEAPTLLAGTLLPSLRQFAITLPAQLEGGYAALTQRHLYVVAYDGRVWVAPSPGLATRKN